MLLTVTTREPGTGSIRSSSSPVSAKWPRWLVPNCISKPSRVVCLGVYITPALLISRSMRSSRDRSAAAAVRTESSEVRSSACTVTSPVMRAAACSPFSTLRTASTTDAPRSASALAVSYPSPVLAPVTTATRPRWSGMFVVVHFSPMPGSQPGNVPKVSCVTTLKYLQYVVNVPQVPKLGW